MSAVIQNEYTGNGSATTYSFTFPYLKTSDIKASLDGVDTTAFTLPNATTLQFNTAPTNGAKIKIFRQTSVDNLTATFYAGSAIKSEDLNDNFTQNLYKTQEIGGRFISALGGTMTGDLNMGEDTVIKFEGATDDAHETTITVADPTADRTITFPNVTGNVVTTGDTGTVATGMIAADAVTGAKIADDQINSEHYVDGSIDTAHIADAQVTTAKIADSNVTTGKLAADAVTAAKLADNAVVTANIVDANVTTAKIAADAVNGTKIADNSIDSEHYVDGSIDNAHLASNSVTLAKMADDSVGTAELVDGSVDTARLADNSVTLAKMTDNSVGTSEVVDAAVTTAKLASNAVTTAKITDANVTTAKIANDAVTNDKLADNSVSTENIQDGDVSTAKIADSGVTTGKIANDAVTTVKIVNNAITSAKIADDAVGSTELGDGVIDTVHVGAAQITTAKIADSNITTAKITDANVTTAKIANDAITIGKIGCEQTTLSDSDSHIPTSGAVVDYVAAQIAPLGGLEVIATEILFPNTQPSSGVVISISDAGGVVVNGSGQSTTGRTVGGSTVTINGFPASLQSKTMAADVGLMVSSTGSSQTYNYHKLLAKEADVEQLSNDINDFASRYRVGSSNPTSSLDNGDLFFNTGTGKMLVYNGTNTAWEEVQSIGNFFISTFSEAFDGSRTQFTLSNAPTNVQQVILSLNGVVQKPGTAFTLSGSTVTLASAPASGTDYFAVVMGSTVNIGTPSNNTVSTAVLQDDSVTTAKIAASNVTATELGANAVITSKIADDAVTDAKLANSINTAISNKLPLAGGTLTGNLVLSSHHPKLSFTDTDHNSDFQIMNNHGNLLIYDETNATSPFNIDSSGNIQVSGTVDGVDIAALSTTVGNITTDVVTDTSPQLGGDLASNGHDIKIADATGYDGNNLYMGSDNDCRIHHDGSNFSITEATGDVTISAADDIFLKPQASENGIKVIGNGAVELYHDNSKKFETVNTGAAVSGNLGVNSGSIFINTDSQKLYIGASQDLQIFHTGGSHSQIADTTGHQLYITADNALLLQSYTGSENYIRCLQNGAVELYYDNVKKFETLTDGAVFDGDNDSEIKISDDGDGFLNSSGAAVIAKGYFDYSGSVTGFYTNTSGQGVIGTKTSQNLNFIINNAIQMTLNQSGHLVPSANNSKDLGTTSLRWRNIYTNDLHLSNEGHSNEVDGTWGNWTIQEGESDLFLKNNRSGKKYKFNLTEVS